MLVPKHLEAALNSIFSAHPTAKSCSEQGLCELLRDEENHILCVLETSNQHDWLIVPLFLAIPSNHDHQAVPNVNRERWRLCDQKKNSLELFLANHPGQTSLAPWISKCMILEKEPSQIACCFPCDPLNLVSRLVEQFGPPSKTIIRDWNQQRNRFGLEPSPSASEVLVTEDGVLIPFWRSLCSWLDSEFVDQSIPPCFPSNDENRWNWPTNLPPFGPSTNQAIEDSLSGWFEPTIDSSAILTNSIPRSSNIRHPLQKQNRGRQKQAFLFTLAGFAACVFSLLVWWVATRNSSHHQVASVTSPSPKPTVTSPSASEPETQADSDIRPSELPGSNGSTEIAATTDIELTTIQSTDSVHPETHDDTQDNVELLLAELRPKNSKFSLNTIDSSSIIRDAMMDSSKEDIPQKPTSDELNGFPTTNQPMVAEETSDISEEDAPTADEASGTSPSEPGTPDQGVSEKSLVVSASSRREMIPYGKRVLPKEGQCEVELKLSKDVVVEPSVPVTIVGNGKATWKIAIEDEQPEIILEVGSKPGAKWQVTYTVGLRESPSSPLVLLAPMNAQIVGNRLIEYNQWINNSIDALNLAKSVPRRRSRIDFVGEIKKLEREQRNVEVAIKNWRTIARLSHLFFDDNQLQIKLQSDQ